MFHANAAMTAQSTVDIMTISVSTSPLPIVEANAPPRTPNHHVAIFHANAAMTPQSTVDIVTISVSTSPLPIVDATAPPRSAPVRLKNAAIAIAFRGVRTRVETTVAIALAASWNPLLYSKMIAARTTEKNVSMPQPATNILGRLAG